MKTFSLSLIFDFPTILGKCTIFDIGKGKPYIDMAASEKKFAIAYEKNIKKELDALASICEKEEFKIAAYFSGSFMTLLEKIDEKQLRKLKSIVKKGQLEVLGGTINHSLSSLYSPAYFEWEAIAHLDMIDRMLDAKPVIFYNTENIYFDDIIPELVKLGYTGTSAGVVKWYLGNHSANRVFRSVQNKKFSIFLIDSENQNVIFENNDQTHYNLQFDLEALYAWGGIQEIVKKTARLANSDSFKNLAKTKAQPLYKVKSPTMGSIHGRSISSYNGEAMQRNALNQFYDLCGLIVQTQYSDFMNAHTGLGKSDIFLQLSKSSALNTDPFSTYSHYMNMLTDLMIRLGRK